MLLIFCFLITQVGSFIGNSFVKCSFVIFSLFWIYVNNSFVVGCLSSATWSHSRHGSLEWSDSWLGLRALGQSPRSLEGSILRPPLVDKEAPSACYKTLKMLSWGMHRIPWNCWGRKPSFAWTQNTPQKMLVAFELGTEHWIGVLPAEKGREGWRQWREQSRVK